jgi:hypothetical protein
MSKSTMADNNTCDIAGNIMKNMDKLLNFGSQDRSVVADNTPSTSAASGKRDGASAGSSTTGKGNKVPEPVVHEKQTVQKSANSTLDQVDAGGARKTVKDSATSNKAKGNPTRSSSSSSSTVSSKSARPSTSSASNIKASKSKSTSKDNDFKSLQAEIKSLTDIIQGMAPVVKCLQEAYEEAQAPVRPSEDDMEDESDEETPTNSNRGNTEEGELVEDTLNGEWIHL